MTADLGSSHSSPVEHRRRSTDVDQGSGEGPVGRAYGIASASLGSDSNATERRLAEAIARLQTTNENLQRALYSRIVIEQAKGVLAERFRLSIDDAFDLLRYGARATRANIHEFAQGIIRFEQQPTDAIVAALAAQERWRRPRRPDHLTDVPVGSSLEASP